MQRTKAYAMHQWTRKDLHKLLRTVLESLWKVRWKHSIGQDLHRNASQPCHAWLGILLAFLLPQLLYLFCTTQHYHASPTISCLEVRATTIASMLTHVLSMLWGHHYERG